MSSLTHRHPTTAIVIAALAVAIVGCEKDEIRTYSVDKPAAPVTPDKPDAPDTPQTPTTDTSGDGYRMLGAIASHGGRTWYLKMLGKAGQIGAEADAFDALLDGMAFTDDKDAPVTFDTVPEGWTRKPGGGMRYATFTLDGYDPPVELSVIPLGASSGSLRDNINRWRSQVGLGAATDEDMQKTTRKVVVGSTEVTVIDMTGPGLSNNIPGRPTPAPAPGNAGGAPTSPSIPPLLARPAEPDQPKPEGPANDKSDDPITVKLPDGWAKVAKLPPMATMAFAVEQDGQSLVTTVTKLGGAAGGVEANVARWARQVNGKAKTSDIEIDGQPATYAFIAGPEQMILGVITQRGDASWFVKLRGPIDPVAAQKANFDALIESIKFNEGA